jgi:hypothetical protein
VDTPNSQKRSPRSSAKSKKDTTGTPEASRPNSRPFEDFDDDDKYMDRSIDQVARVRAAKEVAQREMESFGDVSEYDITIIQGQLKEEPVAASQSSLDFQSEGPAGTGEEA